MKFSNRTRRAREEDSDGDYDPSGDFLSNVRDAIEEAEDRALTKKKNPKRVFNHIKKAVIGYLVECRSSGSKDRPKLVIGHLSGVADMQIECCPPRGFMLPKTAEQQLQGTRTQDEFLPMLRELIINTTKKRKGSGGGRQQSKSSSRKRLKTGEVDESQAPHASPKTTIEAPEPAIAENDEQERNASVGRPNNPGADPAAATPAPLGPRRIVVVRKKSTNAASNAPLPCPLPDAAASVETSGIGDAFEEARDPQSPAPSLAGVVASAGSFDPGYQSDRTDYSQLAESTSPGATTWSDKKTGSDAVFKRTPFILNQAGNVNKDLARIPSVRWLAYYRKLAEFCRSEEIQDMKFEQRMQRIKRILYVSEEECVILSGEWDRLAGVARLCAFLREITGADADTQKTEEWLRRHLKDIRWLKGVLGTRERVVNYTV